MILSIVEVQAQSFNVNNIPSQIDVNYKSSKKYNLSIVNYANRNIRLEISIDQSTINGGSKVLICQGNNCNGGS
ncbi:MAG: hypothetical protein R3321_14875, partial [Nitrososphaeraceae archaeon]|nr:hypothetical protein [Nitrososphaeraceae archaeon]